MRTRLPLLSLAPLLLTYPLSRGADVPQAELSNGAIEVKIYLPDGQKGFYRATRFDWSGMIYSLVYQGHEYYGPWFERVDPGVHDFAYQGSEIVASPCTAAVGPAEEFIDESDQPLGFQEAKTGGTFVKVGVGALRKPDESSYDHFKEYEIVDSGKWTVKTSHSAVEFTQTLSNSSSGYAYVYRKTVRLNGDKPEMVIEHELLNKGKAPIRTNVYNHNFLRIDRQPPGPDYTITMPFDVRSSRPPREFAEIRGHQIVFLKPLENRERVAMPIEGYGDTAKDYDIAIENTKVKAALRITGNQPLQSEYLWSIRAVLAVEPYTKIAIDPGKQFAWQMTYSYYVPAAATK